MADFTFKPDDESDDLIVFHTPLGDIGPIAFPRRQRPQRLQSVCPLRGYLEFYVAARELPTFASGCDDPTGWVSHVALTWPPEAPQDPQ